MGLKALVEYVRVSSLSRAAFTQLQLDAYVLRREWNDSIAIDAADTKTLSSLFDEVCRGGACVLLSCWLPLICGCLCTPQVLSSGAERCVEPSQLLHIGELEKLLS
jgi:hypothetical protein